MSEQLVSDVLVSQTRFMIYRELQVDHNAQIIEKFVKRVRKRTNPIKYLSPIGDGMTARLYEVTNREIGFQKAIGRLSLQAAHQSIELAVPSLSDQVPVVFEKAEVLGHSHDQQFAIALFLATESRKTVFNEVQRLRGCLESQTDPRERYPWHRSEPHMTVLTISTQAGRNHVHSLATEINQNMPQEATFNAAVVRPRIL